jgi:uncharacterized protein YjbI with pentapeptide repeats
LLGPLLLLIVHAYVLLHFSMLADKGAAFREELDKQIPFGPRRTQLRRQLPSNIFVQIAAGPDELQSGFRGFLLQAIAWFSLVIGPLAVLILFLLQFLPYHSEFTSWFQRIILFFDLVLLWLLWPHIALTGAALFSREARIWTLSSAIATLALLGLTFLIATFPDEWLDDIVPTVRVVPNQWLPWKKGDFAQGRSSLHELLVAGDVDELTGKLTSVWSNRLVLPNLDIVDNEKFDTEPKLAAVSQTLSLRGRHLEGAVLSSARLRNVDFTGSHLQGANLNGADLREAKFGWILGEARTDLRGARLIGAQLQGAVLDGARLWGARMAGAQLQGASLDWAELQGARLWGAHLEGASLSRAHLQGASLDDAQLQAASLDNSDLRGASLAAAELESASLAGAQLQGALFDEAGLQGASLDGAALLGASFLRAFVWRADVRNTSKGAFVVAPETQPKDRRFDCPSYQAEAGMLNYPGSGGSFALAKLGIDVTP